MNEQNRMARRYHWLGDDVTYFVVEPRKAVCCDERHGVLNMVDRGSDDARNASAAIARERPDKVMKDFESTKELLLARRHDISAEDIHPGQIYKTLLVTHERQLQTSRPSSGYRGSAPGP